jgi:hypothetical protein
MTLRIKKPKKVTILAAAMVGTVSMLYNERYTAHTHR